MLSFIIKISISTITITIIFLSISFLFLNIYSNSNSNLDSNTLSILDVDDSYLISIHCQSELGFKLDFKFISNQN